MADPLPPEQQAEALKFNYAQPPQATPGPLSQGKVPEPLPAVLRQSYAESMAKGETLGPQDFHDAYHGAGHPPLPDLHTQLPDHASLIDGAIDLSEHQSLDPTPSVLSNTRQNLLDHWASTGQHPVNAIAAAKENPELANRLTSAPPPEPIHSNLGDMIHMLEGSGDNAVSSSGAIGRNQIMPATAAQYGFDPAKLYDPAYNQHVSDTIQADLLNRFHGDTQAVLVAYNAGPETAERWLAAGKDNSVLPPETQNYLRRAAGLPNLLMPGRDAIFDPTAPAATEFTDEFKAEAARQAEINNGLSLSERALNPEELEKAEGVALSFGPGILAAGPLKTLFSGMPEDKAFAQATIRAAQGNATRFIQSASAAMEDFRKTVNKELPEFEAWLRTGPGTTAPMWPAPNIMNLIDHIENASAYGAPGMGGSRLAATSPLAPVAGALRLLYQSMRSEIEKEIPDMTSFYEDYYRHMWENPSKVEKAFLPGRLGSSASMNARTIPTITDGLQRGLKPKFLDPIDNTLHYITGMRNFLMQHRVFEASRDAGYIKYGLGGRAPEDGWVPLKGRFAEKAVPVGEGAQITRAYAPPGFAQSYNRWVGKGFYEWPKIGAIYQKLQFAANMSVGMRLALSGYHAWNIAQESTFAGLTNGIGELAHGELARGLKDIGMSVTVSPKLSQRYIAGQRLQQQYLRLQDYGPDTENLAKLFTQAGGRAVGRGSEYMTGDAANWWKAWRRGSLAQELKHGAARTIGEPAIFTASPKVAPGFTRLYRVETPGSAHEIDPMWADASEGMKAARGRWFTDDPKSAQFYIRENDRGDQIHYIDVPASEADKYKVSNIPSKGNIYTPENPAAFSRNPTREFFLPKDLAKTKLRFQSKQKLAGEAAALRIALAAPRAGAFFGHELGRIMNTVTAPLFDDVIPKIKMAAWSDEMSTWLRNNPLATTEATEVQARKLLDSMDDRFGEMNQDNLFWPRMLKQSLNLVTVSVGWEYGTLRAFGGAAKDILSGNVLSTRARWLLAFPMIMGLSSGIYQYAKTGITPWQSETPVRDLIAPRTGGQTPEGAPERAILPGYEKDPLQWYRALSEAPDVFALPQAASQIATQKLNPMMSTLKGVLLGTDWKGDPIRSQVPDYQTGEVPPGWQDYADFVLDQLTPIVADQPRLRGTAIPGAERFMGIRPAPEFIQNPDRVNEGMRRYNLYQGRQQQRRQLRQNQRLETPP